VSLQRYGAPESVAEAVAMLSGAGAVACAGCTDLLVQIRAGARQAETVVDLKRVPGITGIEYTPDTVRIGAATRCGEISGDAALRRFFPGLVEAAGLIGSAQVQGRASLGGNLCNASPAADAVPALVANRARVLIEGPAGARSIAVEAFPLAPGRNCLSTGEFVRALELPLPGPRSADAYLRFTPRTEMDIAVAGAGVSVTLDAGGRCTDARIAIGAVAPTVLLVAEAAEALRGREPDEAALADCVSAVRAAARPISDKRGSAELRRHVIGVLVRRALAAALRRAVNVSRGG